MKDSQRSPAIIVNTLFTSSCKCSRGGEHISGWIIGHTQISHYYPYDSCVAYQQGNAEAIENLSYYATYGWVGLMAAIVIDNILLF